MPVVETNILMDGGLWLVSDFVCGPYEGKGIFGYDAVNKKHVGTWVDNMSTHLSKMTGNKNENGELVMYSTGFNPMTQEEEKNKSVSKMISDTEKTFTMYKAGESEGEWIKTFAMDLKKTS